MPSDTARPGEPAAAPSRDEGRRLRVMQVVEAMTGGTRRFVLDLVAGLPPERFEQHVVLSLRRDPRPDDDLQALRAAGAEITVLDMTRAIHPLRDRRALCELRELVASWRPDLLHCQSSKAGFLGRAAVRHAGPDRPVTVYSPHCFAFQAQVGAARQRLYLSLERLAAPWTDCYLLISQGERAAALRHGLADASRMRDLRLGVDTDRFAPGVTATRQELGLPEGKLIGVVTSLRPQKAPHLLVRAFARVAEAFPAARLVLVGDGVLRPSVERQVRELHLSSRVQLLGYRTDVHALLPHFAVLVISSGWEGLPYALLEAMACGLPVLVPDLPGLSDLVAEAGAGLAYKPRGEASLVAGLEMMLVTPGEELRSWGAAGREHVAQYYSLEAMRSSLVELYEELAAARTI